MFDNNNFFATTAIDYWVDLRLPGEYPFGGKREIFLTPKVPAEAQIVLSVVEKWNPTTRKIDPLVATEYYTFPVIKGFYVLIPKHPDITLSPGIDELQDSFTLYAGDLNFKKLLLLLKYALEPEGVRENEGLRVNLRIFPSKDFCDRLSRIYPKHIDFPCCQKKESFIEWLNTKPTTQRRPTQVFLAPLSPKKLIR